VVSFALRVPREGRLGRDTLGTEGMLGSEGTDTPDEADEAAAPAPAYAMKSLLQGLTTTETTIPSGCSCTELFFPAIDTALTSHRWQVLDFYQVPILPQHRSQMQHVTHG